MEVNEEKAKYFEAKKALEDCKRLISELQKKSDILEESLPSLNQSVEEAGKAKISALDAFALNSGKQSESVLKGARETYDNTQKKLAETHELVEATHRALKKRESEFPALQTQVDSLRHQVWNSLFEQKNAEIPASVRATVNELVTIGLQCSMGLNFILPKIFPLPTNAEIQKICKEQAVECGIDE